MENNSYHTPDKTPEFEAEHGLWLRNQLLIQLVRSAKIGLPLMALCILLGISTASMVLFTFWLEIREISGDFYLMEGKNPKIIFDLLMGFVLLFLFARGIMEGKQAWSLLKFCETDDAALLEGTERLGKMFRWFVWWAGVLLASLFVDFLMKNLG